MTIGPPHRGQHHAAAARGASAGGGTVRRSKQSSGEGESRGPTVIGEKAKLSNADEAAREHVLDEAPEKLHGGERHRATLTVVRIVLPAKRDALAVKREQAVIADRDSMRIPAEIPEHGGGSAEGRLRIDDPVGAKQRVDKRVPVSRFAKGGGRAAEIQFAARVRAAQSRQRTCRETPDSRPSRARRSSRISGAPSVGDPVRSLRPGRRSARADAGRGFVPRCGGCSRNRSPHRGVCGSAATSSSVAALARNSRSYRSAALRRHSGLSECGSVKTTWTYDTSSSSRSRAASQRSRACAWHLGQCRLRHELYEMARCPQVPH